MSTFRTPQVFLSYTRSDGQAFARALREKLENAGVSTWWDREDLRRTPNWWRSIDEALDAVAYIVIILSAAVLDSEVCRREWQWGRQKGKCVVGVKAGKDLDDPELPRWLRKSHIYDALELHDGQALEAVEWQKLVDDLRIPPTIERVPFMVGDRVEDYVQREKEYTELKQLLVDPGRSEPVAITAALRGAGGYGKTTLARALCHDLDVREAFDDGILWVTLGENAENLLGSIRDLIQELSGARPDFATVVDASVALSAQLAERDLLLVIDDAWKRAHVEPFLQGGRRCARLITTRMADALPQSAKKVKLDAMRVSEAVQLLTVGLPEGAAQGATALASRLGEWPLLLKLANRVLHDRVQAYEQPVDQALRWVEDALDREGLTAFDARDPEARNEAVGKTLGVSLALLDDVTERQRFFELAVFPEDVDVPLDTVVQLWGRTGKLDRYGTEKLCEHLFRQSLLDNFELRSRGSMRLHDAIRKYLRAQVPDAGRRPLHDHLIEHWGDPFALPDPYAWRWFGWHASQSSHKETLSKLLCNFAWLRAKLQHTDINGLLSEFDPANVSPVGPTRLIGGALRLSAHVLAVDKSQLAGQLLGRLKAGWTKEIDVFRDAVGRLNQGPWLRPLGAQLDLPGGSLLRTLDGHGSEVEAVALSADGKRAASGSRDGKLKVWDVDSGRELATLIGHGASVGSVALSADGGCAVSGSRDATLKVWDVDSGRELATLTGHSGWVSAVALSADGKQAFSGATDETLKVWNVESGQALATLHGDSAMQGRMAFSANGKQALSGSRQGKLKVWDVTGGRHATLEGSSGLLRAGAISTDGKRAASAHGSPDTTLIVWDLESGRELATLQGHRDTVTAVALSADGKLAVSGSTDRTLKVWDVESGVDLATLEGHGDWVEALAISADGTRSISAGAGTPTVKIWDLQSSPHIASPERHRGNVYAIAFSADGKRAVSGSKDRLKVWDVSNGWELATLQGDFDRFSEVVLSGDGARVFYGADDHSLKAWDVGRGSEAKILQLHTEHAVALSAQGKRALICAPDGSLKVRDLESGRESPTLAVNFNQPSAAALSADGRRALTGSHDHTLIVWDAETGRQLATIAGGGDYVNVLALSADGTRAVARSDDHALKVWDVDHTRKLATLKGHTDWVSAVALSADGQRAVSGSADRTVRVWDVPRNQLMAVYSCDHAVRAVAFAGSDLIGAGDDAGGVHFLLLDGA